MDFAQIVIMAIGIVNAYIFNQKNKLIYKYGSLLSLISQPFWIYSSVSSKSYGIFVLSLWYLVNSFSAVYREFLKKEGGKIELER